MSFDIRHDNTQTELHPSLFDDTTAKTFAPGDLVIRQGEESDYLYYIVSGEFEVLINEQPVSKLTADDMFIGEISFLLKTKRSASILALTEAKVLELSKNDFIDAIKKQPYYALLLARLLAQRIQRINHSLEASIRP